MMRSRSFDLVRPRNSDIESSKLPKLRGSVGSDLSQFAKDQAIVTDPEETRRRRTIRLVRRRGRSWGFTLQTYGIRNKRSREVEVMSYVDYVEMSGPACISGMRRGDIILSVNGESVESCTHAQLVQKIQRSGLDIRLVVLFEDCCRKVELHERYLKLKRMLALKIKELRKLEEDERILSQGMPLSRVNIFRQSTISSASSDWDTYSEVSSPTLLESVPANQFAFKDNRHQSMSDISILSSSASTGSGHTTTTRSTDEESSSVINGVGLAMSAENSRQRNSGEDGLTSCVVVTNGTGPLKRDTERTYGDRNGTGSGVNLVVQNGDEDKEEFVQSGKSTVSQGSEDGFQHLYNLTRCAQCITQVSHCPHQAEAPHLHVPNAGASEGGSMTNLALSLGSEVTKITSSRGASPQAFHSPKGKSAKSKKKKGNVFYIESDSEDSVVSLDLGRRRHRTASETSDGSDLKKVDDSNDSVFLNTSNVSGHSDVMTGENNETSRNEQCLSDSVFNDSHGSDGMDSVQQNGDSESKGLSHVDADRFDENVLATPVTQENDEQNESETISSTDMNREVKDATLTESTEISDSISPPADDQESLEDQFLSALEAFDLALAAEDVDVYNKNSAKLFSNIRPKSLDTTRSDDNVSGDFNFDPVSSTPAENVSGPDEVSANPVKETNELRFVTEKTPPSNDDVVETRSDSQVTDHLTDPNTEEDPVLSILAQGISGLDKVVTDIVVEETRVSRNTQGQTTASIEDSVEISGDPENASEPIDFNSELDEGVNDEVVTNPASSVLGQAISALDKVTDETSTSASDSGEVGSDPPVSSDSPMAVSELAQDMDRQDNNVSNSSDLASFNQDRDFSHIITDTVEVVSTFTTPGQNGSAQVKVKVDEADVLPKRSDHQDLSASQTNTSDLSLAPAGVTCPGPANDNPTPAPPRQARRLMHGILINDRDYDTRL